MLKLIKTSMLNTIQVHAEVVVALRDFNVVVVVKNAKTGPDAAPMYDLYATNGRLQGGQIKDD